MVCVVNKMTTLEKFISLGGWIEAKRNNLFICFGENKMRIPVEYFYTNDPEKTTVLDYYLDIMPQLRTKVLFPWEIGV